MEFRHIFSVHRNADINLSWDAIRKRMEPWRRITITLHTPDGQQVIVRQDTRPSPEVAMVARQSNLHVGVYRQRM